MCIKVALDIHYDLLQICLIVLTETSVQGNDLISGIELCVLLSCILAF
jgi:hypothetical protein